MAFGHMGFFFKKTGFRESFHKVGFIEKGKEVIEKRREVTKKGSREKREDGTYIEGYKVVEETFRKE